MGFLLNPGPIKLVKTTFVDYSHADLAKAKQFLLDFGLKIVDEQEDGQVIYFGGYGPEPFCYIARKAHSGISSFNGAAYAVEAREELIRASEVPGATSISTLQAPGGGEIVTLRDPVGHPVNLVFGQAESKHEVPQLEKLTVNFEDDKPRKGRFHRFNPGPAPIHKWGHYGVTYPEGHFQQMMDWYTQTLSLGVSDLVFRGSEAIVAFFHIDRGQEYTDHHCFFFKPIKPGAQPGVAHSAFEVHDFDIQQLGHQFLESRGYDICWGVGRHVLGSQVFDYWFDTSGFILEHYADGDLVNCDTPVSKMQAGPEALAVWGPPVPEVF